MSKAQMVVDAVLVQGRSVRETAQRFGMSKSRVHQLVQRYRTLGPEGLVARSTRPHANSRSMDAEMEERIVAMRKELLDLGADAGAQTIHHHLVMSGWDPPSTATIYRCLRRRGFVTPQPRKRPRASYVRFEAELPNECWQSDMTHWQLADGRGVEIVTFLDDHSRKVLSCVAVPVTKAADVRRIFAATCAHYGVPASVLTDNGAIYNARARGGRTGFESDLLELGVLYKHSSPYHPQTCGKVERWHRTLKGLLGVRRAETLEELNDILEEVVTYYNDVRPHRARGRLTPSAAYDNREKLGPHTLINEPHYRLRTDIVDIRGHVTLRYLGKLRHLNVGWPYRGQRVTLYIIDEQVEVVSCDGEIIGTITLDRNRDYHPITRSI
jgi:transposase InsO family protein